ncbi:hypothetical protein GCM10023191_063090 [Actinoallomurus oryzae]|uniref:SAM-dependent methyltransferase n=1 Tax=Actinoallomurus oryzae TaxID=502180 RepID=A0ABP8QPE4_9ACTN
MTGFLEATRTAYDTIAGRYAERFHDELADQPLERALKPDGHVLIAVLVGDERLHRTEAFGHEIALDYHLRPPELLADEMTRAGLTVTTRVFRERQEGESLPRAFLLARKPVTVPVIRRLVPGVGLGRRR